MVQLRRDMLRSAYTVFFTVFFWLLASGVAMAEPDLILRHGEIHTGGTPGRAESLAVAGGRIVAVGPDREVAPLAGPKTRVVELGGRAVLPALTDGHAHLAGLGFALARADLRHCRTPDECARRAQAAPGPWALGRGWDQNEFPTRQFPTRDVLDAVLGRRPAWLVRVDGHAGWASSEALRAAGITRATPDPSGGRILRDAHGDPSGVLVDAAMDLVERALPHPTRDEIEGAILRAQDAAIAAGLTEVHEMGIDQPTIDVYRALDAAHRLKLRVRAFAAATLADALPAQPPHRPDAMFELLGVKLFADGALGSRGAALLQPYSDDPKNTGLVLTSRAELERIAHLALRRGFQVAVHAIGDRGNRAVLDAFEAAGVTARNRFRIEHAQVVALEDFARFARLGVIASMQPTHATSDKPWAEARVGKERLRGAYAWRRMLDAGAHVSFGSDFPVEEVDAVAGLRAAVERGGWTLDQKLGLEEAVHAFTWEPAFAAFEETWRGRAEPGQAADLTVLDASGPGLPSSRVDLTVVGGRVVFERR
jgi:predicted amidohydrolase YtcJ